MKSTRKKVAKAAGLLMALQLLEHTTGLFKQILIAASFGASATMDTYIIAASIVGLIVSWVGLPIHQTVIPMFRHDLAQRGERMAWANVSVLFNTLLLGLVIVVLAGEFFARPLVAILAPGFGDETKSLATSLLRITMITVVFVGAANVLSQIFFAYERFFRPGIAGAVNNLIVLLALFAAGSAYGIHGLAVAAVLGAACEIILQLPILWEKREFYCPKINLRHPSVTEMGKLGFPLLISTGGFELSRITDRIFASLLSAGSLSALAFAHRPTTILLELLVRPLNRATFPHFTKLSAEGDLTKLSRQLFSYARVMLFVTLPVAAGLMLTADLIIDTLYGRGAFDRTAVAMTSQALFFYAIGLPAHAMGRVFRSTFFGLKETWTPTKIALFCFASRIFLSWVLIGHIAHRGIALADSIAQITNVVLLFCCLPREVKGHEGLPTLISFAQTFTGCMVMAAVVYLARANIDGLFSSPLELAFLVLLGAATYGAVSLFFQKELTRPIVRTFTELGAKYLPRTS